MEAQTRVEPGEAAPAMVGCREVGKTGSQIHPHRGAGKSDQINGKATDASKDVNKREVAKATRIRVRLSDLKKRARGGGKKSSSLEAIKRLKSADEGEVVEWFSYYRLAVVAEQPRREQ
ncbi:hypothetical protein QQ045_033269 [Rhodiola kirilowii]